MKANEKWEFYMDERNEWRWRKLGPSGNVIGSASQGYASRNDCEESAKKDGWNSQWSQSEWKTQKNWR